MLVQMFCHSSLIPRPSGGLLKREGERERERERERESGESEGERREGEDRPRG